MALLAICILAVPEPAQAWLHPGTPVSCQQAIDNGCAASPGGSVQIANLFSGFVPGSSYATRPTANEPCVDYACGMPAVTNDAICGIDHIQDPATATIGGSQNPGCGVIPSNCHYFADGATAPSPYTGRTIGSTLTCNAGSTGTTVFKGFELGPVGGHNGTTVYWFNTSPGNLTLAYNRGLADIDNYRNGAFLLMGATSAGITTLLANTLDGQWETLFSNVATFTATVAANVLTVTAMNVGNTGTIVQYQALFGFGLANPFIVSQLTGTGGLPCPDVTCNGTTGTYSISGTGSATSRTMETAFQFSAAQTQSYGGIVATYNYFHGLNSRPMGGQVTNNPNSGGTWGDINISQNMFYGFLFTPFIGDDGTGHAVPGLHGEVWQGTSAPQTGNNVWANVTYNGNAVYQPATALGPDTTAFAYISTGGNTQSAGTSSTYTNVTANDNAVISRNVGLGGSAFWSFDRLFYGTVTGLRNYIDPTGATNGYGLCTEAPFVGGILNHTITPYSNVPTLTGNKDLNSGANIDSSMITYDPGATGCVAP